MNILPPCLCNRPQKSSWLKVQCSNCLGVLKDSQSINCSSQASFHLLPTDTFSKSLIEYLSVSNKSIHKRSCTGKAQQSLVDLLNMQEKDKNLLRNPSEPLLIHKANQLSAPTFMYKKKDYLKKESLLLGHTNSINCLELHENLLWTTGMDYKVMTWNIPLGLNGGRYEIKNPRTSHQTHTKSVTGLTFLNPSTLLTSSIDKTVKSWKVSHDLQLSHIYKHNTSVKSLSCLQSYFISGTADSNLHIWDIESSKKSISYSEHLRPVCSIDTFRYNTFLTGSEDSNIKLWDSRTVHSISSFNGHIDKISGIKIVDQYCFVSGSKDQVVKTWDIRTLGVLYSLDSEQDINAIDAYKDTIFIAGEKLQIWNKGTLIAESPSRAKCLKYFPNDRRLAVGSYDDSISIYKTLL